MRVTSVSPACIDFIGKWEGGFRLVAYLDVAGVATISAGITRYSEGKNDRVRMGDTLPDVATAKSLFARRLKHYEAGVDALTRDNVSQAQFDALVSLGFNIGISALASSMLIRRVNNETEQPQQIQAEFEKWIHANGRKIRGLWRRRRAEAILYLEGEYLSPDDSRLMEDE